MQRKRRNVGMRMIARGMSAAMAAVIGAAMLAGEAAAQQAHARQHLDDAHNREVGNWV